MEEYNRWFESLSFSDKIQAVKGINDMVHVSGLATRASMLRYTGYLTTEDRECVSCDEGDWHVYVWKHAWGDPFYVGSGKNHRWTDKNPRCDEFFLHLDHGDAAVYLLLDGVDQKTAHLFEKYVSENLSEAGYSLANGDNNMAYASEAARERRRKAREEIEKHELAPLVQNAVMKMLNDEPKCDYRTTDAFLMKYGTDFFSRNYWAKRKQAFMY